MKTVYAFDFDGTLTTADTLIEFVRYTKGDCLFAIGFLIYSPLILLMKLGILSNWKVKQSLFSWFFKGDSLEQFDDWCQTFARDHRQLLRTEGIALMDEVLEKGEKVLVISASVDNWVVPFFAHQAVKVLGTQLEVENGKLTGRFKSHNCYGKEKVNRLLEVYPQRSDYTLIAFGDSRGDKELLEFADEAHYKPFLENDVMVYVIALISILLGAFAQYFLKVGMNRMNALSPHTTWELVQQMLSNLSLWGGISCYGLSMLFWLYVLSRMELSRAYPLVSLGYVFTLIIGYYLLGESISIMKLLGVALIIGGVFCISQ